MWLRALIIVVVLTIIIGVGIFLSGCASVSAPGPVMAVCVPMASFTPAQEKAAAGALQALPDDSPLVPVFFDWIHMRDAARACLSQSQPTSK